jgi:hypothetical protein
MAKARSGRKVARKVSRKPPARGSKKAPAAKRKPVKRTAARRVNVGAKGPSDAAPARAVVDRPRARKSEPAVEASSLPEIAPPLPAPIASFTF